ncbi:MAG: aminopeptidase P family protein [bacterium]
MPEHQTPDHQTIAERLSGLRELMAGQELDVYLVPSSDEHQNEYLPAHTQRRHAISGFAGSAGEVVVTAETAHLFVDSRYHLQGEQEVPPGMFQVHKLGLEGEAELPDWLTAFEKTAGRGVRVGFDPFLITLRTARRLSRALKHPDSALKPVDRNLVDAVWDGRPAPPLKPVISLPDALTGETTSSKLERVRHAMAEAGAAALVLTRLDDVAWLTNRRGGDIPFNPVFDAYMVVEAERAVCYTGNPGENGDALADTDAIHFAGLEEFPAALKTLGEKGDKGGKGGIGGTGGAVWLDPACTSEGTRLLVQGAEPVTETVTTTPNPVTALKAIKNPVEITVSREAHLKAGAAKVRSLSLLHSMLAEGERVSEAGFAELLAGEYAKEEGYRDFSFGTISAYGANGAIVHYGAPDPERMLEPGGLLLIDSGVQMLGATTDDTRTIAIGTPDEVQRRHFTSVMRGHIRLAMQIFPAGTTGIMLDALARSPLWNEGLDYGHGTGHGVGAYLNVHEGPQSISARGAVPLEAGMIVSNEPGYYRPGWGGIRIENLYVVEEALGMAPHPAGKSWLRLSPLTAIPFDAALIDMSRLMAEEKAWLTGYHLWVAEMLSPRLEEPHRRWLIAACAVPR